MTAHMLLKQKAVQHLEGLAATGCSCSTGSPAIQVRIRGLRRALILTLNPDASTEDTGLGFLQGNNLVLLWGCGVSITCIAISEHGNLWR